MKTPRSATALTLETIRARRVDDEARRVSREGVLLTHDEADALGDEGLDWLRTRLGLRAKETDRGIECRSAQADIATHAEACADEAFKNRTETTDDEGGFLIVIDEAPQSGDFESLRDELGREPTDDENDLFSQAFTSRVRELRSAREYAATKDARRTKPRLSVVMSADGRAVAERLAEARGLSISQLLEQLVLAEAKRKAKRR